MTFETNHFSRFLINEWISSFDGIKRGDRLCKAAYLAYSNSLIGYDLRAGD
jgi:hypothetical protein